jgi:hypothetical protein
MLFKNSLTRVPSTLSRLYRHNCLSRVRVVGSTGTQDQVLLQVSQYDSTHIHWHSKHNNTFQAFGPGS